MKVVSACPACGPPTVRIPLVLSENPLGDLATDTQDLSQRFGVPAIETTSTPRREDSDGRRELAAANPRSDRADGWDRRGTLSIAMDGFHHQNFVTELPPVASVESYHPGLKAVHLHIVRVVLERRTFNRLILQR